MSHRGKLIHLPPNRVWRTYPGGRTLDTIAGTPAPADTHFAEDWIASTTKAVNPPEPASLRGVPPLPEDVPAVPPGVSRVRIGTSATLHDFAVLIAGDPEYFLGREHLRKFGPHPQLLVKYLDSGTRLHFQVHPTREFAQRVLNAPSGKTEAYHVLAVRDADPVSRPPASGSPSRGREATGHIYVGFQRPPTAAQLRDFILTQDIAVIEACFDPIPVRPGDTFIIPGGTPHALGAGIFMVEIQEPSDLVIRFEFERAGYVLPEASRFMNRDVDFALSVFDLAPLTADEVERRIRCRPRRIRTFDAHSHQDELIGPGQTDCFRLRHTRLGSPVVKDENCATIAIVTAGGITASVGGEEHSLRTYDKIFLPAGLGPVTFKPHGTAELLECLPPQ